MNDSAVIRLLYKGLPAEAVPCAPFTHEALDDSPLRLPENIRTAGTWTMHEHEGLSWLERPAPGLPAPLYMTGATSSSLDIAKALLQKGLFPEWSSVLCLSQSSGRGQMRRAWASPAGNIYAALRLPNEGPFATFAAAPAIGGLLAEALKEEGFPVVLKWPNDLLQPESNLLAGLMPRREDCRKVGGILLEERKGALVAGIGINTHSAPPDSTLRDNYAFSAGIIRSSEKAAQNCINCEKLNKSSISEMIFPMWKRLVERIFSCYSYSSDSASWWPALAEKHLAFRGCSVSLADACPEDDTMVRVPCEGIVDGVTSSGALRLKTEYGMNTFLGGSLLPRQ